MEERRAAERFSLPEPVPAGLGTTGVHIIDISPNGARVQHEERIVVGAKLDFRIDWEGHAARIRVRVARSELGARSPEGKLLYITGLVFEQSTPESDGVVTSLLRWANPSKYQTAAPPPPDSFGDSSNPFLRAGDLEVPDFIRCDLVENRWKTSYVSSPDQPADGFTITRDRGSEVRDLQRVYEIADPETRRMMRNAFAVQIKD